MSTTLLLLITVACASSLAANVPPIFKICSFTSWGTDYGVEMVTTLPLIPPGDNDRIVRMPEIQETAGCYIVNGMKAISCSNVELPQVEFLSEDLMVVHPSEGYIEIAIVKFCNAL